MRRWYPLLGALGGAVIAIAVVSSAWTASPVVNETVAIVDPYTPAQQAGVDSSGNLKVVVSGALTANQSNTNAATGVYIEASYR